MKKISGLVWDIEEFKRLNYKKDYHKDLALTEEYVKSGHKRESMDLWNYWEPNPMPATVNEIKKYFSEFDNVSMAVHKTPPGYYLPMHRDLFGRFKEIHNLSDDVSIYRAIVMLEDSQPGQIFQIGNTAYAHWEAGQVFDWFDEELHAIYNFSMHDRYAIQITGAVR